VATVMSNLGLEVALKNHGLKLVRTQVGDRYVLETMLKSGYNLGGEQSGHLVFLNHSTTGDGILTALRLLAVMLREQKPLAELASCMEVYPQVLLNLRPRRLSRLRRNAYKGEAVYWCASPGLSPCCGSWWRGRDRLK
jgi:phosphoglucosamine mutase